MTADVESMPLVADRPPRHHVLLVGIDAYEGGRALRGCVNDIDAIQALCLGRLGIDPTYITRLAAPVGQAEPGSTAAPTLANLRAALAALGGDAVQEGDRVIIYYSGHGTQCTVRDRLQRRYLREALVPSDHLAGPQPRLLFDWELNQLLGAIAQRTSAVTVVLDCCSAAGATRSLGETTIENERYLPMVDATVEVDELPRPVTRSGLPVATRGVTRLLRGIDGCQVIAACRDTERAREWGGGGARPHGELTRALLHHIAAIADDQLADARWSWIWNGVETDVRAANPRQHPWLYGSFGRRIFGLGTDDLAHDVGIPLVADEARFRLGAGALAGITRRAELAVYGSDTHTFPVFNSPAERQARLGILQVTEVAPASSIAVAKGPLPRPLPPGARAHLVRPGEGAKLRLHVTPPAAEADVRRAAQDLVEVTGLADAEAYLARDDGGAWTLTDDLPALAIGAEAPRPVVTIPHAYRSKLRQVLEHYHAHRQPWRLAQACRDLPSLLRLTLLACNQRLPADTAQIAPLDPAPAGAGLPYAVRAGDAVCLEVENASTVELSITVIDSTASGAIAVLGQALVRPLSRHRFWDGGDLGKPFAASLPPGVTDGVDRLVAIGTTRLGHDLRYLARRQTWHEIIYGRASAPRSGGSEPDLWTSDLTALHIYTADPSR